MHVNVNVEVPQELIALACREAKTDNADRACELLLQRMIGELAEPAATKSTKKGGAKKRR